MQPVEVDGAQVVPMHLISKLTPPAPKYREEIQEVIDEGLELEEGAFLVRVEGEKGGEDLRIDSYVNVPGLRESFEKAGVSHESYYTGGGASLFTKMFVNGRIDRKGVFPPEALDADARAYFLKDHLAELDITVTVDEIVQRRPFRGPQICSTLGDLATRDHVLATRLSEGRSAGRQRTGPSPARASHRGRRRAWRCRSVRVPPPHPGPRRRRSSCSHQ